MAGGRADWSRLTAWLAGQTALTVTISWIELDRLVGGVPASATRHYPQWWHGDRPNTRAWRRAGYELDRVELGRLVRFRRGCAAGDHPARLHQQEVGAVTRIGSNKRVVAGETSQLARVDPMRALIVLQCSANKALGGAALRGVQAPWPDSLHRARARVGAVATVDDRLLMPAWQRYTGHFYTAAGDAVGAAMAAGAPVVILSGGYGVVRAQEPIAEYNKRFRLSDWPPGLLSTLLVEEAARVRAQAVVAFVSTTTDYAQLVRRTPWRRAGVAETLLVTIDNPGGGAMVTVPHRLGQAFRAFWQCRPEAYPDTMVVETLL